jgi:hypothetical protein
MREKPEPIGEQRTKHGMRLTCVGPAFWFRLDVEPVTVDPRRATNDAKSRKRSRTPGRPRARPRTLHRSRRQSVVFIARNRPAAVEAQCGWTARLVQLDRRDVERWFRRLTRANRHRADCQQPTHSRKPDAFRGPSEQLEQLSATLDTGNRISGRTVGHLIAPAHPQCREPPPHPCVLKSHQHPYAVSLAVAHVQDAARIDEHAVRPGKRAVKRV